MIIKIKNIAATIITTIVLGMILGGCANNKSTETTSEPSISVYNGSISEVIGCMFAPSECDKIKKEKTNKSIKKPDPEQVTETDKEMNSKITEDFDKVDQER